MTKEEMKALIDRFLRWPLPESVCADLCATKQGAGRIGTNLLTASEAQQMFEYVLSAAAGRDELQHRREKRLAVIEECRAAIFHRFRKATTHSLIISVLKVLDDLAAAPQDKAEEGKG